MQVTFFRLFGFVVALSTLGPPPAGAQPQTLPLFEEFGGEERWGVSASFTPTWVAPNQLRWLIGAENLDVQGSDFRIGFVRGRMLGGEWGVSFVSQRVNQGSTVELSKSFPSFPDNIVIPSCSPEAFGTGDCGAFYTTASGFMLRGFELHRFVPFATFADRVQVGMNIAGGAGWYRGTARLRVVNRKDPDLAAPGELIGERVFDVAGSELTLPRDFDAPVPLFNLDFAVAGIVGWGLKVRGGAGYGLPGRRTVFFSVTYFFGAE